MRLVDITFLLCFLAGAMSAFIAARPLWARYLGCVFGQLVYGVLFLPIGPLAVVGLLFLVVWPLVFLVGAYLTWLVRKRLAGC